MFVCKNKVFPLPKSNYGIEVAWWFRLVQWNRLLTHPVVAQFSWHFFLYCCLSCRCGDCWPQSSKTCSFLQKHRKGWDLLSASSHRGMQHGCVGSPLDCSCSGWLAVLSSTERLFLLLWVWALSPTATYTTGKKECTGLMTRRKSDKPHSHPSASIGQHWASESPAHSQPRSGLCQKACGNIVSAFTHVPFAWEHVLHCCSLRCSTSPVTSAEVAEVSARQDTEQEGWNGVQGDLTPSRLMGN